VAEVVLFSREAAGAGRERAKVAVLWSRKAKPAAARMSAVLPRTVANELMSRAGDVRCG